MNSLPENLKLQRTKLGLTQKDMADRLEIGTASYQRYESGAREPKLDTLIAIADVLGTSTDFLLGRNTLNPDQKPLSKWDKLGTILTPSEKEKVINALTERG